MQKIGLQKIGEFDHPLVPAGHPLLRHVLYRAEKGKTASSIMISQSLIRILTGT